MLLLLKRAAIARSLVMALLVAAPAATLAEPLTGKVIGVEDGDSITVLVDERPVKVRLAEIDAPERAQPWGNRSKQALSAKVFGRQVTLEVVDTDRYGRSVANVRRDGRDLNREMVREGHAWVYRKYMRDPTLLDDEAEAQAARAGLWDLPETDRSPPWEWRHGGAARQGVVAPSPAAPESPGGFTCGGKRYCKEMSSCAEAVFYLAECGLQRLDGDGDGVPCEVICR